MGRINELYTHNREPVNEPIKVPNKHMYYCYTLKRILFSANR